MYTQMDFGELLNNTGFYFHDPCADVINFCSNPAFQITISFMNADQIRKNYFDYMKAKGHTIIPRANLVPQDDPTTLFTGSGMQPLIPYLLGAVHPAGKRLVNSQPSLRAQDIEEVGNNRHTTFFEMLGNWALDGEYFKKEQIRWFFDFLVNEIKLDPKKIYVSCFIGSDEYNIPKDTESAGVWQDVFKEQGINAKVVDVGSQKDGDKAGMQGGRIFFYDDGENWWSRGGGLATTPVGDPCGPDSEVFYDFGEAEHDASFGAPHPASDSGRFMEIGNQVFMQYRRTKDGFEPLAKPNVDFGAGLERVTAASINSSDVFKISLLWPIVEKLEELAGKKYAEHTEAMRIIADHLRGAVFLAVDGVVPSNKEQGYVARRLMRRAIMQAHDLGITDDFVGEIVPVIADLYHQDYPEVAERRKEVINALTKEEKLFRQTLKKGLREFKKRILGSSVLDGELLFVLHDTYGFPTEITLEEAKKQKLEIAKDAEVVFEKLLAEQRERSQTAGKGVFKGGLADQSNDTKKHHTATHLMYEALRRVLGDHVTQRGSNVTGERLRFDFSHDEKMTDEQKAEVERIVNEQIDSDLAVEWHEYPTDEAFKMGAKGAFGDKYGEKVKVYTMGKPGEKPYSIEICGGPHVEHTSVLGEGGKRFKIQKEESSSSGVRRIKAALV